MKILAAGLMRRNKKKLAVVLEYEDGSHLVKVGDLDGRRVSREWLFEDDYVEWVRCLSGKGE